MEITPLALSLAGNLILLLCLLGAITFLLFERTDRRELQKKLDAELFDRSQDRKKIFAFHRVLDGEFALLMRALSRVDADFLAARLLDGRYSPGELFRPKEHCLARLNTLVRLRADNATRAAEEARAKELLRQLTEYRLGTTQAALSTALQALSRVDAASRKLYRTWDELPAGEEKDLAWLKLQDYLVHVASERE